jgi:DNA-binding MarR family transcriptional regulator
MPVLLASALRRYGQRIRRDLAARGYGDLPTGGSWLIGALAAGPKNAVDLASELHWTKQAVSRLADLTVERGYLTRAADPHDRRRILLELTDSGREVAAIIATSVRVLTRELGRGLTPDQRELMRQTLADFAAR